MVLVARLVIFMDKLLVLIPVVLLNVVVIVSVVLLSVMLLDSYCSLHCLSHS